MRKIHDVLRLHFDLKLPTAADRAYSSLMELAGIQYRLPRNEI